MWHSAVWHSLKLGGSEGLLTALEHSGAPACSADMIMDSPDPEWSSEPGEPAYHPEMLHQKLAMPM